MDTAERAAGKAWTAEEFLETDQHEFGDAWRYELVDGRVIAHAAPSPDHGTILSGLTTALGNRLRGRQDCPTGTGERRCRLRINNEARPVFPTIRFVAAPCLASSSRWFHRLSFGDGQLVTRSESICRMSRAFRRSWNSANERLQPHLYRREERGPWSFEAIGDP